MIFDSALEKYSSINQDESSQVNSKDESSQVNSNYDCKLLFRGVVHECDKMIRVRNNNVPNATPEEMKVLLEKVEKTSDGKILPLPCQFHVIYAKALYFLSLLEEKSDGNQTEALEFINEALYRIEIAMEMQHESNKTEILFVMTRALVQKALILQDDTLVPEIMEKTDLVFKSLKDLPSLDSALELAHLITSLIGLYQQDLLEKLECAKTVCSKWKLISDYDPKSVKAFIGLAILQLGIADECIEYLESSDEKQIDSITLETAKQLLESALEPLEKAKSITVDDKETKAQIYTLLGECHVNLGNLLDTDPEDGPVDPNGTDNEASVDHYKCAVDCFQTVVDLDVGALPEAFVEFLQEWKVDIDAAL